MEVWINLTVIVMTNYLFNTAAEELNKCPSKQETRKENTHENIKSSTFFLVDGKIS